MQVRMAGFVFFLAVVSVFPACMTVEERRAADNGETAWCGEDSDCPSGLECHLESHLCALPDLVELDAALRLVPPSEGMVAVEEQYPQMVVNNRDPLNLKMHRPIQINGRVLLQGAPLVSSQQAHIVAVAPGDIPGLSLHQEAKALQTSYTTGDGTTRTGFEFQVMEDSVYDIYVHLSQAEMGEVPPVHVRRSFSPKPGSSEPFQLEWDIEVPDFDQYLVVTGTVVSLEDPPSPVQSAKVVGFSQDTGNITSTGVTNAAGEFTVLVPPPADVQGEEVSFQVRPSLDNELVPSAVFDDIQVKEDMELGELTVGSLANLVPVTVLVADEAGIFTPQTLGGTVVRFSGGEDGSQFLVERTVSSQSQVAFSLPPGTYVLSVVPPAYSTLGIHQELLKIDGNGESGQSVQVALQSKPRIHGWVLDPQGAELARAHVVATFTGKGVYPDTAPLATRKVDAWSDDSGHYEMNLDPGQYSLVIDPPAGSGLPRRVLRNVFVSNSQQRTLRISYPVLVTGRIDGYQVDSTVNEAGETIETFELREAGGVRVELFNSGDLSENEQEVPIPTATGTTDSQGRFTLIVPADADLESTP